MADQGTHSPYDDEYVWPKTLYDELRDMAVSRLESVRSLSSNVEFCFKECSHCRIQGVTR